MGTDKDWEWFGRVTPYFGVLAVDRYRCSEMSDDLRREFFATGEGDVGRILNTFGMHLPKLGSMTKALDFGCGVGRLAIPMATRFDSVVGVDISDSMIKEAERNAQRQQVRNLRWCTSLSELAEEKGSYSFINTLIVLQHIPAERGLGYICDMIALLGAGGGGAIQLIYGRSKHASNMGEETLTARVRASAHRRYLAILHALKLRPPSMQMNAYPINKVLFLLQNSGITNLYFEFTKHGGFLGATIYFIKP